MKNTKNNNGDKKFTIIKKEDYEENFENSNLIGKPLNEGPDGAIEDGYQNANFNRNIDTLNIQNISSDIKTTDEKSKLKNDIKELGLQDSQNDES